MNRVTPLILAVALFMEMMDSTVIATSLPAIAADIGATPIALKLAMTAYLVALAIFIPVSGWMADRFGAKTVLRWAILVFMAGSLACAFSSSLPEFVAARFLQGIGGSMMTPLARLILVRATPKSQLVSAMAWLTIPALFGPMAGPPIGGFLTTYLSWHWIFFINIPIGLIGIVSTSIFLPKIGRGPKKKLDWTGFVLLGVAFSGVLFGLSVISQPTLPPQVGPLTLAAGSLSGLLYYLHTRRSDAPLLDPRLFRHATFRTAIIGGTLFRIGFGAFPFLFPLLLQIGFGMTPFQSGLITLFGAVGAFSAKFMAQPIYVRFGFKWVMASMAVASASLMAANGFFTVQTPVWLIISALLGSGLVRSTFFTGTNAMCFAEVDDAESGQATAIFAVATQISFALGVAVAGGILEFATSQNGGVLRAADFPLAFFIVAAISVFALVPYLFLARDAGSAVSGHVRVSVPPVASRVVSDK